MDVKALRSDLQRVCAEEIARCVRSTQAQLEQRTTEWQREMERSMHLITTELSALREVTNELQQSTLCDHKIVQLTQERLMQLEDRVTTKIPTQHAVIAEARQETRCQSIASTGHEITSDTKRDEPQSDNEDSWCEDFQDLVKGDELDLAGLCGLNLTSYLLQFCRIHRPAAGIWDQESGSFMSYSDLLPLVATVASGLHAHGFQGGHYIALSSPSGSSLRVLVIALAVWSLNGTVDIREPSLRVEPLLFDNPTWRITELSTSDGDQQGDSSTSLSYEKLASSRPISRSVLHLQTPSTQLALRCGHEDGSLSFWTHGQLIEGTERSLLDLHPMWMAQLHETVQPFVLNGLPHTHPAGFPLGIFPAMVMGHSLLQVASALSSDGLIQALSTYKISSLILSPQSVVSLSDGRTLRRVDGTSLRSIMCIGAPVPALPRALKSLANWNPDLQCWRVLCCASTDMASFTTSAGCFVTSELLVPLRGKSLPSPLHQELGRPSFNTICYIKKRDSQTLESLAPNEDDNDDHEDDGVPNDGIYEVFIQPAALPKSLLPIRTGVFATVSWDSSDLPQINAVALRTNGQHVFYPTLPIEELVASHPLVSDAAVLVKEGDKCGNALRIFVQLTPGAQKYAYDSIATIEGFLAKKSDAFDLQMPLRPIACVHQIPRDANGFLLADNLLEEYATDS